MSVLFDLPDYEVHQSWWRRRLLIRSKRDNRKVGVPPLVESRLFSLLLEIRNRQLPPRDRQLVATYVEQAMVECCFFPGTLSEEIFLAGSPQDFVDTACLVARAADSGDFTTAIKDALFPAGRWTRIFDDGQFRLELEMHSETLRVLDLKRNLTLSVAPSQQARHQEVVAAIRAKLGETSDSSARAIWLWTRSFCRAISEGPTGPLAGVLFLQVTDVVADMIAATRSIK